MEKFARDKRSRSDADVRSSASANPPSPQESPSAFPPSKQAPQKERAESLLPNGDGAIRGLDERFSVNAATDAAGISITLRLAAGRSGFTPQLELSYDSGSRHGPFGFRWSVPLRTITRKTDKALPRSWPKVRSEHIAGAALRGAAPRLRSPAWPAVEGTVIGLFESSGRT